MSGIIFPERESKLLEFKSRVTDFAALIKTSIAFANAAGGRIVIGVDDKTREIIGITDSERIRIHDDFPNSLYDSASPNLVPQIYEQNFGEKTVAVIEIPASPRKPYFLKSVGVANGTYIRIGSSTRKANQEYIEDLVREAQRITYDEEIVHQSIDVLSSELLKNFYGKGVTYKRLLADKILTQQVANKELLAPTIAGVLMFTEEPQAYVPEALIRCTRFKGKEGRDIIRTEEITGSIEQQSAIVMKVLETWLATDYELQGAKLKGRLPIPEEALREAVLNALMHRKYNIPGAIKIAIYDDRLEIFSPGCFPGLVDINNLGDGITYLRNPVVVRLAHRMGLIETLGSGIRLIFDSCYKAGIKAPEYHDEGDFVKVIFYFHPHLDKKSDTEAILALIQLTKQTTAGEVAEYLGVSRNTAIRKLSALVQKNQLVKVGKGPSVKYKLVRR
ncbi:putative DNA binding domain-containing protein [Candidatus Berkiella cookevillensis]|uniref:DNA binding domain-containing protein n=1 Tax=Candidatus Berkiella cookevillensis TaxID=437022 RepID=A0A0Q9Y953_9GAMM|nr:RNA-binding domain-containing protein [Candidatus Berkiella cookevillensis]MCS5707336.1 putative DNA binding domain-containing protein [Candidatus Berkiella cookevillensis]